MIEARHCEGVKKNESKGNSNRDGLIWLRDPGSELRNKLSCSGIESGVNHAKLPHPGSLWKRTTSSLFF
jgi:hypothetical protein